MTLETGFWVAAIVAIVVIFVAELLRRRVRAGAKLPAPVLFALRILLGVVFIILGIIGGFVPLLQGWVFILLAALVLFPQSRFAVAACDKIERKLPRLVRWLRARGIGTHKEDTNTQ